MLYYYFFFKYFSGVVNEYQNGENIDSKKVRREDFD